MEKLYQVLNDDHKSKGWFARNYFWAATLVVFAVNLILFFAGGSNWIPISAERREWESFYMNPIFQYFLRCFGHRNPMHVVLNMVCFFVVGLYLERRIGTCKLLLLIIVFAFFTSAMTATNSFMSTYLGFSGVNYALYFYIYVDLIFVLSKKSSRTLLNIILGAIVGVLIYIAMGYNGTNGFRLMGYPYDLVHNMGHYTGAFAGILVVLIVHLAPLGKRKPAEGQQKRKVQELDAQVYPCDSAVDTEPKMLKDDSEEFFL